MPPKPLRKCPSCTTPFRAGKGRKVCDRCRLKANKVDKVVTRRKK